MTEPKISIVTISYNQGEFLEQTIRSVVDQGYPNLEYIVVDGGSTDASASIIDKYADQLAYWVSEPDRGQSHALNKGFDRCTGDLLGWLNSDDRLLPGSLERFANAWRDKPDAGLFVGDANLVDTQGQLVKVQQPGELNAASIADWERHGFSQPACLFSRAAWEAAKPVNEELFIAMDFALWLRMAKRFPVERIPAVLAEATIHPSAKTQAYWNRTFVEVSMVQMREGYEELARERMMETFSEMELLRKRIGAITRIPFYSLARPFIKWFWRKEGVS